MIEGQAVTVYRINLFDMNNSQINWDIFDKTGNIVLYEQTKKSF